jgi:TonB family protein
MGGDVRVAAVIVRLWTRIYTAGLPEDVRNRRREEIASDLWEAAHAPDRGGRLPPSLVMLIRLAAGTAQDLSWRIEKEASMTRQGLSVILLGPLAAAVVVVWATVALRPPVLPEPAPRASQPLTAALSAPPPPPPGPPPTPGHESAPKVTFTYADVAYQTLNGTTPPARLNDVRPVHPPMAKWNGVGGTVVVDVTVDEDGRVADIRLRESVPMLDQSAIDAIRRWTFAPAAGSRGPVVIRVSATYPISPVGAL